MIFFVEQVHKRMYKLILKVHISLFKKEQNHALIHEKKNLKGVNLFAPKRKDKRNREIDFA